MQYKSFYYFNSATLNYRINSNGWNLLVNFSIIVMAGWEEKI